MMSWNIIKKSALWIVLCLLVGGCSSVPVHEHRLVSKSNMAFSDSLVFNYENPLQVQVEPGSGSAGAAKSGGCTSCN